MAAYASNCPISGPVSVGVSADVDFNGVQFSYQMGMMFPAEAVLEVPLRQPETSASEPWPSSR